MSNVQALGAPAGPQDAVPSPAWPTGPLAALSPKRFLPLEVPVFAESHLEKQQQECSAGPHGDQSARKYPAGQPVEHDGADRARHHEYRRRPEEKDA